MWSGRLAVQQLVPAVLSLRAPAVLRVVQARVRHRAVLLAEAVRVVRVMVVRLKQTGSMS